MRPLLTLRDVVVEARSHGQTTQITNGISLDLARGEVLGLIGESGAGKSTIGKAAMGYTDVGCRIAAGAIDFDGINLVSATPKQLRAIQGARIAYVAQSAAASLNPARSILAQFIELPVRHGVSTPANAQKKAINLYRKLGLPNPETIGHAFPHQLSGGQQQRAMVAMAMACDPDLIVFDEPTTALDVTTQIGVLAAIRNGINYLGSSALYITHDLAVVAQIADRIMVLRNGATIEQGNTRQILHEPTHEYTATLISARRDSSTRSPRNVSDSPLLYLNNVDAAYGNTKVLSSINATLRTATTLSVVGESGSGKSTLARVICGLLRPVAGDISFSGRDLSTHYSKRDIDTLRRIQLIYQSPDTALNPRHRIGDIVGRPLRLYFGLTDTEIVSRVEQLLQSVDLDPGYMKRFPSAISGGEKQRVCIARALAADPALIVCDEITSALDTVAASGVLDLMRRLQDEHAISYIFISHDLSTVRSISDEVLVMYNGEAVDRGTVDDVFSPPYHWYTERLLNSIPQMDSAWLTQVQSQVSEVELPSVDVHGAHPSTNALG